jgi:hypothetical protein
VAAAAERLEEVGERGDGSFLSRVRGPAADRSSYRVGAERFGEVRIRRG